MARNGVTALLCCLALSAPAAASGMTVQFLQPSGLPGPFYYHTIDLQAIVHMPTSGWLATFIQVDLLNTSDFFFQAELGTGAEELSAPLPSLALGNPLHEWDTFVTTPQGFPNVLDDNVAVPTPPIIGLLGGDPTSDPQLISAAWGLMPAPVVTPGSYTITRLTIASESAAPLTLTPVGLPLARLKGETTFLAQDDIQPFDIFIYRVPEPGTLALLASAAALGRGRRRT